MTVFSSGRRRALVVFFCLLLPTLLVTADPALGETAGLSSATTVLPGQVEAPLDTPHRHGLGSSWMWLLAVYCALIVLASLAGGWLPFLLHLTHTRMQLMISFVAGLMLGVGMFHMLPHAVSAFAMQDPGGAVDRAVWWTIVGLLTMFFLIRAFHFHHHAAAESPEGPLHAGCVHDHDHDHDHAPALAPVLSEHPGHSHELSWLGVTFGLALHTMIDGLALAASVQADALHGGGWGLFGLGTFAAVLLHKPLDALSITSLMTAGGWPRGWQHGVNLSFAMMCPVGAVLFSLGVRQFGDMQHVLVGAGLAFAAGVFLCISLGDLLPEVEFHAHDRVKLSALLVLGVALAYAIGFLEPAHVHGTRANDVESAAVVPREDSRGSLRETVRCDRC